MKYEDFREELRRAGLSNRTFAALLGLNPNSISNCKAFGVVPTHLAVIAALIRAMKEAGLDYASAIAHVPIETKASRGRALGQQQHAKANTQRTTLRGR